MNIFYCRNCGKLIKFIKRKVEYSQYVPTCPLYKETEIIGECKVGDCEYYYGDEIEDFTCKFIYCGYTKKNKTIY